MYNGSGHVPGGNGATILFRAGPMIGEGELPEMGMTGARGVPAGRSGETEKPHG
jgi:hypothetical protein